MSGLCDLQTYQQPSNSYGVLLQCYRLYCLEKLILFSNNTSIKVGGLILCESQNTANTVGGEYHSGVIWVTDSFSGIDDKSFTLHP